MGSGSGLLAITTRSAKNMRVNSGFDLNCWVPITRSVPLIAGMD